MRRPLKVAVRSLLAAAMAVGLAVAPATQASAAATLTLVPYGIDSSNQAGWWSPLETYVGGSAYAYLAFNEPAATAGNHKVAIARRDGSGNWTKLPVMNGAVQAEYADDIGHNQPSIARDGSGRFHVLASMHNNTWRYFRSDVTGGNPQYHGSDMPDFGVLVTYPVVTTAPNGDVYLIARINGASSKRGTLYRWNNAASTWSIIQPFADSPNRSVYPDDLQFDSAGNLHILWEWSIYPSSGFRHELSYLKYSPATGTFSDHTGAAVTVPVSTATADIIQPLTGAEVYGTSDAIAVQSAKLTLDGTSPKVAYRYRTAATFAVYYAWISSGSWSREIVYNAGETSAAIDITWHPVDSKRIYFAASTGVAYAATKPAASWTLTDVAPGIPVSRLAVERDATGTDILYLVDLSNLRLYYGRN